MGKNIGFIGCGNMGKAILRGLLEAQMVNPKEVMVSTKRGETSRLLADTFGVQVAKDNGQVAHFSQVLFLGVKPFQYEDVLREIRQELREHTLIIGMAAGITLDKMEKILGSGHKLVKIMPNTPVMVKAGVTAMSCSNALTEEEKEVVRALLRPISTVVDIEEKHMDVITGIAGSSPAYVYQFIEAMADAGVKNGLPRKEAYEISAKAVLGAAKMVLETGLHPGVLKDMVTSPGGTTIAAVAKLEEKGLRHAVISAVDVCVEKSKEMSQ